MSSDFNEMVFMNSEIISFSDDEVESTEEVNKVMGFSGFGGKWALCDCVRYQHIYFQCLLVFLKWFLLLNVLQVKRKRGHLTWQLCWSKPNRPRGREVKRHLVSQVSFSTLEKLLQTFQIHHTVRNLVQISYTIMYLFENNRDLIKFNQVTKHNFHRKGSSN